MDDEQLIELVREYSVLYDLSHPKYMDTKLKFRIWNTIGKKMQVNGSLCKSRWNNIRDNYRKSLKKLATKQSDKKIKVYKYSQQLNFLNKYFAFEENVPKSQIDEEEEGDHSHQEIKMEMDFEITSEIAEDEELQRDPISSPALSDSSDVRKPIKPKSRRGKAIPRQTFTTKLIKYLIAKNNNQPPTSTNASHPVDAFLAGLAPTLKELSPLYLNLAKSEIFATVQKYERKMLEQQTLHSYLPTVNSNVTLNSDPYSVSSGSVPTLISLPPAETFNEHS